MAFEGVDVRPVDVQVQITSGLPAFSIVGLPDKAVAESKERVRGALHALGLSLPPKHLTVNLATADVSKTGSHFDLPIALGLLAAMDVVPALELESYLVLGELALDAGVRRVTGVLPAAMYAQSNGNALICPDVCGGEAAWAGDLDIIAPKNLLQLINHIKGIQVLARPEAKIGQKAKAFSGTDLADVKGQESAKRALEIAAAGGHNMLMMGPPGSGKSMLASCLPGILPDLTPREALDVSMIHSVAGVLPEGGLVYTRPYRDPHHSASLPALVGGGQKIKPGEISLAHNGVLFLDELPEFNRKALESLRQPLESGSALIARANQHSMYPARFQLIAAMNPCRCGHLGEEDLACNQAPKCAGSYQSKISGPMLDRIDLHVDVPAVSLEDIHTSAASPSSATVSKRVCQARNIQEKRYYDLGAEKAVYLNAYADTKMLDHVAVLDKDAQDILNKAMKIKRFSARGYYRLLRVARTIADLDGASAYIHKPHIAEALSYRRRTLS